MTQRNISYSNKRKTILIVDDADINRILLCDMLEEEFDLLEAADGEEALSILDSHPGGIDLMLLDINMPRVDGYGVLSTMAASGHITDTPVIMISAETGSASMQRAFDLGAVDFITRPFESSIVHRRILNTLRLYGRQKELMDQLSEELVERERNNDLMVSILSHIVEFRNGESGLHVRHINQLTELLIDQLLSLTDQYDSIRGDIPVIRMASSLHDIGKIGIPGEILNKPGHLTAEEFTVIKTHSMIGAQMMSSLPFSMEEPLVRYSYEICRWHHERWDGRGYPDGLKGDEIPIAAQIVSLADVYDALTSKRCYKDAYSHEKAVQMILNNECGVFNPLLLECLNRLSPALHTFLAGSAAEQNNHNE